MAGNTLGRGRAGLAALLVPLSQARHRAQVITVLITTNQTNLVVVPVGSFARPGELMSAIARKDLKEIPRHTLHHALEITLRVMTVEAPLKPKSLPEATEQIEATEENRMYFARFRTE